MAGGDRTGGAGRLLLTVPVGERSMGWLGGKARLGIGLLLVATALATGCGDCSPKAGANAGEDQIVTLPAAASLIGAVWPTGSAAAWAVVEGPGTVTFANAAAAATTATFSTDGAYVLRLTATNGTSIAADEVTLRVWPSPVTRSFRPSTYTPGLPVTVTITLSDLQFVNLVTVTETAPSGWRVSDVSDDGLVRSGTIEWAWLGSAPPDTLTYTATPPVGTTGSQCFGGEYSVDRPMQSDEVRAIGGLATIAP